MPIRSLVALLSPAALILMCGCPTQGFQCGTPLVSDPDATYACERPEEVCVCSTRSCAKKEVAASDAKDSCLNGLRYVPEADFLADDDLAGKCVDEAHEDSVIDQLNGELRCPFSPPLESSSSTVDDSSSGSSDGTSDGSSSGSGTTMSN